MDTPTNVASYQKTISVAKGDTVDFAVGPGGNGYICDSTGLTAKITLVAPTSGGTVYDAAADLTKESIAAKANPNGAWSYGCRGTAVSSELTLYPLSGVSESWRRVTENVQGWWLAPTRDAWSPPTPFVLKNVGAEAVASTYHPFSQGTLRPGEMYVHPGPANIADRPPANVGSDYAVGVGSRRRREATRSTRPSPAWTPGCDDGRTRRRQRPGTVCRRYPRRLGCADQHGVLLKTISVAAGDKIDFAVGPGGNGNVCDSTGLAAKITAVAGTLLNASPQSSRITVAELSATKPHVLRPAMEPARGPAVKSRKRGLIRPPSAT